MQIVNDPLQTAANYKGMDEYAAQARLETEKQAMNAIRAKMENNGVSGARAPAPEDTVYVQGGKVLDKLDLLVMELGRGQVPMRRKQGVFRPRKLVVEVLRAYRIAPPPALIVRFDNNGHKTTFSAPLHTV